MPLYDYRCDACGVQDEYLCSYDASSPRCSVCDSAMRRLPSSCVIKVKDGWVSSMEHKFGKYGHPYEDESGNPRPGQLPSPTMKPGPRTKALWRAREQQLGEAVKAGAVPADEANAVYQARPDR